MSNSKVSGLFFLVLFFTYGYLATDIHLDFWSEQEAFNARSLPYLIAVFGMIVSLLLIILPSGPTDFKAITRLRWIPAILLLLAMSIYGALFETLGFIVATMLFLLPSYAVLGERRILAMLLASVPLVLGFWLLMDFLGIYLNPGDLFFDLFVDSFIDLFTYLQELS
jgi:putative tricarboxylic transport membrane protein